MKSVAVFDMRDFDEAEWFENTVRSWGLHCPPALMRRTWKILQE